ncbi:MAG: thymidine phosphorylase [Salinarimonadaceae bacterium]|nr:MAG: thymidine phosphorylase [Salinarimonadaceae bacterium]
MLPQEIIRRKRDGLDLSDEEIACFVAGIADGGIADAQVGAFAMAVFLRGLSVGERVALTQAMTRSGEILAWDLPGPVLDKHSTGGVGDCVSLALAPAVAACGGFVPMIAGRGLGHTGGTVDKLEAIPGYDTRPDPARMRAVVRETGCAIVGQSAALAPADRRLYAIRDVTGTVESLDLITASILSKKLAAGLDALVMDVKCGSGAFMASLPEARELARSIVDVANGAGLRTRALITDMNEALAPAAGNALEVAYVIDYLAGRRRDARFHGVTTALGGAMLALGGLSENPEAGARLIAEAIESGRAAECFARMVAGLGGPADLMERPDAHLARAPVALAVKARRAGLVAGVETRALGLAIVALGGGRSAPEDKIDHAVGASALAEIGVSVDAGDALAIVHARDRETAEAAARAIAGAYMIADAPAPPHPFVVEVVEPSSSEPKTRMEEQ